MKMEFYRRVLTWSGAFLLALSFSPGYTQQQAGDLDDFFGGDGIVTTTFSGQNDIAHAVALQKDGKIVAAGVEAQGSTDSDFAIARYSSEGTLDQNFDPIGQDGKVTTDIDLDDVAYDVAIQPDRKIIAAGESGNSGIVAATSQFSVVRYNEDGSLDTNFGPANTGKVTIEITNLDDSVRGIAIQPSTNPLNPDEFKIILAGTSDFSGTSGDITLIRLNSDGSIDDTFGQQGTGIVTTLISNSTQNVANDVAILPNGQIVVAARSKRGVTPSDTFVVIKYDSDGIVDPTFGIRTVTFSGIEEIANALSVQTDGKIVVAGIVRQSSLVSSFGIARLKSNGDLDQDFNGNGKITLSISGALDIANDVSIQTIDGQRKIVVVGTSDAESPSSLFTVTRLNEDGSFDTSFGNGGLVETEISDQNNFDRGLGVVVQADNNIVAVGATDFALNNADFAVVRYLGVAQNDNGLTTVPSTNGGGGCFIDSIRGNW